MKTIQCPYCRQPSIVIRYGLNRTGTQRYRCETCQRVFTPDPRPHGYAVSTRQEALRLYLTGMSLRKIAKHLHVHHQSVANWVQAAAQQLPDPVVDRTPTEIIEMDELYTFVESKKTKSTSSRRSPTTQD
jgi:transposase-like protein